MKKYIGYALWLIAFTIPFRGSYVETEEASNVFGLFSFLVVLALVFIGYVLVDGAAKTDEAH